MLKREHLSTLLAAFLLINVACTKQKPEPVSADPMAPLEHLAPASLAGTSQTVLQKKFVLKTSATFPFEIPAHAVQPHLHGIFASFAGEVQSASDDAANIDFLLLNEEQQADLASNHPSEALFTVEASHNQAVNFDLPAALNQPVKYYLVFRNRAGHEGKKVVQADFRVDF